jgi:hypothetical protein
LTLRKHTVVLTDRFEARSLMPWDALLEELKRWGKDPKGELWYMGQVCHAVRKCNVRSAQYLLCDIMVWGGQLDADKKPDVRSRSSALGVAITAAAALVVVGTPPKQQMGRRFIMDTAETQITTMEHWNPHALLVGLAVVDTKESLIRYCEILNSLYGLPGEVFLALPHDTKHEFLVQELFQYVKDDPYGQFWGGAEHLIALDVLSRMSLAEKVVPKSFWQETWDLYRVRLTAVPGSINTTESGSGTSLRPRLRAWMKHTGITDPALKE